MHVGYTVAQLKTAGYAPPELRQVGFAAKELIAAGFAPNELRDGGYFNGDELKESPTTPPRVPRSDMNVTPSDM